MSSGTNTRQRTVVLPTRLRPDEADAIKKKARDSGVPVSEFLRCAALGRKTRSTVDDQIINELRRLGGLVKHLFTEGGSTTLSLATDFRALRVKIEKAIEGLDDARQGSEEAE